MVPMKKTPPEPVARAALVLPTPQSGVYSGGEQKQPRNDASRRELPGFRDQFVARGRCPVSSSRLSIGPWQ